MALLVVGEGIKPTPTKRLQNYDGGADVEEAGNAQCHPMEGRPYI